jgi:hypothetical protein
MSHFSSADESCKHGNDVDGRGDEERGKDDEDGTAFAMEGLFAAAKSRWHDTWEVPITATDLSVPLIMRLSSSSLLPG